MDWAGAWRNRGGVGVKVDLWGVVQVDWAGGERVSEE